MSDKKKILSLIINFEHLNTYFHGAKYLIEKISKNFNEFYIINCDNLKYFPKKKTNYNFTQEIKKKPKNVYLVNPKDDNDFEEFVKDKELIVINHFGRDFFSLKIHLLMKKFNFKQVQISNVGNIQMSSTLNLFHIWKSIKYFFFIYLFKKITPILSNLGIISKIEILFLSNKNRLNLINNNFFKKIFYRLKFFLAKKIVLVNSKAYDILSDINLKTSEDYIVHLDYYLNYRQGVIIRGYLDDETIKKHHADLEIFLLHLSKKFRKQVVICIHPSYPIEEFKNYYKNFKVVQYQTREHIYKAHIVTFFDSSSITDAILLKKKIIALQSNYMTKNEQVHSSIYVSAINIAYLNIQDQISFPNEKILLQLNEKTKGYDKFINNYHCLEHGSNGTEKIINIIKKEFF